MSGFRMNAEASDTALVYLDGEPIEVTVAQALGLAAEPGGELVRFLDGEAYLYAVEAPESATVADSSDGALRSPMPGKIANIAVALGETVAKGQTVLVLEAMKMEHALAAPFDGVLAELSVETGQQVREGAVLARLERGA